MNLKEVTLEEIELHRSVLEEGLSSLLHSIIFVRAPSGVRPEEHRCAILEPLVYAKCSGEVDLSVTNAVKLIGMHLTGVRSVISSPLTLLLHCTQPPQQRPSDRTSVGARSASPFMSSERPRVSSV